MEHEGEEGRGGGGRWNRSEEAAKGRCLLREWLQTPAAQPRDRDQGPPLRPASRHIAGDGPEVTATAFQCTESPGPKRRAQPFASSRLPLTGFLLPSPAPLSAGQFSEKNPHDELFSSLPKASPPTCQHASTPCGSGAQHPRTLKNRISNHEILHCCSPRGPIPTAQTLWSILPTTPHGLLLTRPRQKQLFQTLRSPHGTRRRLIRLQGQEGNVFWLGFHLAHIYSKHQAGGEVSGRSRRPRLPRPARSTCMLRWGLAFLTVLPAQKLGWFIPGRGRKRGGEQPPGY